MAVHPEAAHPTLVVRDAAYDSEVVTALVAEVQQEYVLRYGAPDETPLAAAELTGDGAVLVGYVGEVVIGCAALRRHDAYSAEIKRMYVRAAHRGQGYGRDLLRALEERARELGYRRVVLETGEAQPEAVALYTREGYEALAGFGRYRDSPLNRCFQKRLARS